MLKSSARSNKRTSNILSKYFLSIKKIFLFRSSFTYVDLFKNPKMRRISLLSIILWMVISCVFDTTVRNISNLNFDFYVSFMVAASMELPADLFSIVGINWFGRRWSASLALLFCSLTMVVCAFVKGKTLRSCRGPEILSLRNILAFRILQVFVFLLGRFFATYAMNVGFQYTVEVMPTCLRGQGIALVNVMSMVSMMASPYIVYSVRLGVQTQYVIIINYTTSVGALREDSISCDRSTFSRWSHSRPLPAGDC